MVKCTTLRLIGLSMTLLPTLLSSAALNKYAVPQQQPAYTVPSERAARPVENVYSKFERKIETYDRVQLEKVETYYFRKKEEARRAKNRDAVIYYNRLIEILDNRLLELPH